MADHCEEQEMEAEALGAIFDSAFQIVNASQPFEWSVDLFPMDCTSPDEHDELNHVGIKLHATLPLDYPEALPQLSIEIAKGLAEEHSQVLLDLANEEAQANESLPCIFAVCEKLREWLVDNNVKGMDDVSMHAQMMRKQKEAEKSNQRVEQEFESQKKQEEMTEAEKEELAVRKRREEGTPCTTENFEAWRDRFEKEMEETKKRLEEEEAVKKGKDKKQTEDKSGRLTGFQQFSGKAGNLEAMEAAVEEAEKEEIIDGFDEELFDEEDEDLDDLDFDDEEDEEVDI